MGRVEGSSVLMISPTFGGVSGVGRHVEALVGRLHRRGFKVEVISTANTFHLPVRGLRNVSFVMSASLKTFLMKASVVHAHNLPCAIPMRVAGGMKVLTLHGVYSEQLGAIHGPLASRLASCFEGRLLRYADLVTVVSRKVKKFYEDRGVKVEYIPNAIDLEALPLGTERIYEKQLIFAGRLSREKGVDMLLKAVRFIDTHLIIIGGGPLRKELEALADLRKVHFLGPQPWDRTIRLIRGSDALILPSRVEAMPTVVLEAMACKTPIIASNVGGIPELLSHGSEAILVPPGDYNRLAMEIKGLLMDEELRRRIVENARRKVEREYCWSVVFPRYLKAYGLK